MASRFRNNPPEPGQWDLTPYAVKFHRPVPAAVSLLSAMP